MKIIFSIFSILLHFPSVHGFVPQTNIKYLAMRSRHLSISRTIAESKIPQGYSIDDLQKNVGSFLAPAAVAMIGSVLRVSSYSPLLMTYIPVLVWGLRWSKIGSWKSLRSNIHRIGGILTLVIPMILSIWEAVTSKHVHPAIYGLSILVIICNVGAGASLIPRKVPAYDIPTLRAFAVGTLLAVAFVSQSLFFRFGSLSFYEPIGKLLAVVSLYAVIYAWSDALQHLTKYVSGDFKSEVGRKWYLPFKTSSYKHIFLDCLYQQPTKEALDASVSPANFVTVCTTFLTAVFASISLLQLRYLVSGSTGLSSMSLVYPELVRWSTYEALLACVANNFGTFAGTLVIQNKVSQKSAGIFNALGLLIPVLNFMAFIVRKPELAYGLLRTSFGNFS